MGIYAIYDMIGKNVSVKIKGTDISGICENVRREILDNEIFITLDGKEYRFLEPNKIETGEGCVIFVYGSEQTEDFIEFCGEELSVHWGEDIRKSIGREKNFLKTVFTVN